MKTLNQPTLPLRTNFLPKNIPATELVSVPFSPAETQSIFLSPSLPCDFALLCPCPRPLWTPPCPLAGVRHCLCHLFVLLKQKTNTNSQNTNALLSFTPYCRISPMRAPLHLEKVSRGNGLVNMSATLSWLLTHCSSINPCLT